MKNILLRDESALYYECGYSCDNAIYLQLGDEAWFFTDGRYGVEAREAVRGAEVVVAWDILAAAAKRLKRSKVKRCAYDPKEWDCYAFGRLQAAGDIRWKAEPDWSHRKRIIKRPEEIELLAKAARLGAKSFDKIAKAFSKEGFGEDERSLHFLAERILRKEGKRELSFDPIVAIGPNAAKPHALPTRRKLKKGDLLLVDAGIKYKRYCSDRTRTARVVKGFDFGTLQRFKSRKMQRAYDTVLKAHDKAIEKARSGMEARKVDALARDVIEKAGFGEYFVHSTGHGVGLDIHEMPYISSRSRTRIEDGMVFTVEPGIYLPGAFGIRIEDMVVMRHGRAEIL
ncbi:M24 family metallopeptidase [Nitratifractor salsuginis]|uniref:Peptidase M24 n=1 Tax=Nitratifractor salsuginis (strain DSM 16511 / JCM 12458 / E9I37-1) TaxID=749222 RepID=E6WZ86_NITSE|nr:aminopeptidase P family protein [Nitratifractor salsuginis]ADV46598.1 peptidase M24 [Nitratifractor salsuginis DSM 16511]